MQAIKVLGAQGSSGLKEDCVSFQINNNTLVDAGNVISELGESVNEIENIFISHAHFDHIRDLPFIIESYYQHRTKPLNIFASAKTINAIEQHLFNNTIWPEFHKLEHPTFNTPLLKFNPFEAGESIILGENKPYTFTAFNTQHCEGSLGFVVEYNSQALILCSDTYVNDELTHIIKTNTQAKSLFIETSFPNELEELAKTSQHLTPNLLFAQLKDIERPLKVFVYHLKPLYKQQIKKQVCELLSNHEYLEIAGFLDKGQQISVFNPNPTTKNLSPEEIDITQNVGADKLASILKISEAFSGEYNLDQLLDLVIDEAILFTQADAATLYRFDKNQKSLNFTVVRNNQLNIKLGGVNGSIDWPALPLYHADKTPNNKMVAALCALQKKPLLIDNVYGNKEFDFTGTKEFDKKTGYHSHSMLVVPLLGKENELLGVIQLINKASSSNNQAAFTIEDKQGTLALASQAAMSISNAILINQMEELFDAFANAINVAFDKKCFFTGMHINQVAELAQIISKAIDKDTGLYADINYTPQMLHTIKVAALVHDVGKIATPESVLHKATKLQANIDRVELIEQRFMLYKQSLIIDRLTSLLDNKQDNYKVHNDVKDPLLNLENDFTFIQKMNSGKEFLSDKEANKIKEIASIQFKIEGQTFNLINPDELQHLLIRRGTLTETERLQIQEHARLSLEMLQTLPFPNQYGKIIDIAANHHEKLNGTGYPRGLDAKQLTLEDEILVLADIYEALSSPHRPYKKPMDLSQVVNILCHMANDGEIDANLVRFFFESGIYKDYNHHLNPDQITDFTLTIDDKKAMTIYPNNHNQTNH